MAHELSKLAALPGARRKKFRVGRGIGSGNGKTAGRGTKGQLSRSGAALSPGFEGGQMPIQRRLPKRGFRNIFAVRYDVVNLSALERLEGVQVVDLDVLEGAGLISGQRPVKILANGALSKALVVKAHAFSAAAVTKIQSSGGSAEVL